MKIINCILIDDEKSGRIVLRNLLEIYFTDINIVGEAGNIDDAFKLINQLNPDLIFLDIQMPGGDGFELLKKFETISFETIFVTSYDKYAMNAIKFSALDYLLKPVDVEELKISISKIREKRKNIEETGDLIKNLLQNINANSKTKKLAIHVHDQVKFIDIDAIVSIEANGSYVDVYTKDQQKHLCAKTLKELENYLEIEEYFIRINKSIIINAKLLLSYSKGESSIIVMETGQQYEISRRRKIELKSILDKYCT